MKLYNDLSPDVPDDLKNEALLVHAMAGYAFIYNDPLNKVDYNGLIWEWLRRILKLGPAPAKPSPSNPMDPEDPAVLTACIQAENYRMQCDKCWLEYLTNPCPDKEKECNKICELANKFAEICNEMNKAKHKELR